MQTEVLAGLLVLRVLSPRDFEKATFGALRFADVKDHLAINPTGGLGERHLEGLTELWKYYCNDEVTREVIERFGRGMWEFNFERESALRILATEVADAFTTYDAIEQS